MSKQTVWLITMLSLMVVLSAYYIVKGPVEPIDEVASDAALDTEVTTKETNPLELTLFGTDEEEGEEPEDAEKENEEVEDKNEETGEAPALGAQDYFLALQSERSSIHEQLIEKYTDIMTDPEATEEQVEKASAELEKLRENIDQVTQMEELIRGEGYDDALVMHEKGKYDITVQADKLTKKQAVEILELIQNETEVPASFLTVSYHP